LEETRTSGPAQPPSVFHRSRFAMNTRFSMVLVGIDPESAESLALEVERDLRALERLMTRFHPASPVSHLNRRAAYQAVRPPDELWQIFLLCRTYWQQTDGAFDITLRPLHQLWRDHLSRGAEPPPEAILQARQHTGFDRLLFDEQARTLRFAREGMSLDLGGFGKGYALERLATGLREHGVERAFLSFGESSITVLGAHPHGPAWPAGIANLFDPAQNLHTFHLRDASLSSSGTAPANCIGAAHTPTQHSVFGQTIDPRTGRSIEGYRTVSVAARSAIDAEVLSTALLLTPLHQREALLARFSLLDAVEIVYHSIAGEFLPRIDWKYGL